MENIIIIGAGGFGLEVVDLIEAINKSKPQFNIYGFLDDNKVGSVIALYSVLGTTKDILKYKNFSFVVAIANPIFRKKYFEVLYGNSLRLPNIIHPSVEISNYAFVFENQGIIINSGVKISALSKIDLGVILDTNVYIGHQTHINRLTTVYSGALIAGNVEIEQMVEIGMAAKVIQGLEIGENTVIGAGSTVVSNIQKNVVAVGSPCKPIKDR